MRAARHGSQKLHPYFYKLQRFQNHSYDGKNMPRYSCILHEDTPACQALSAPQCNIWLCIRVSPSQMTKPCFSLIALTGFGTLYTGSHRLLNIICCFSCELSPLLFLSDFPTSPWATWGQNNFPLFVLHRCSINIFSFGWMDGWMGTYSITPWKPRWPLSSMTLGLGHWHPTQDKYLLCPYFLPSKTVLKNCFPKVVHQPASLWIWGLALQRLISIYFL